MNLINFYRIFLSAALTVRIASAAPVLIRTVNAGFAVFIRILTVSIPVALSVRHGEIITMMIMATNTG